MKILVFLGNNVFLNLVGKIVVFVDDVLFIGCIVWVVFDVLVDIGCFDCILLVVMVDCGY